MNVQTINRDGKPEYVVLPWADYQALLEAAEGAIDGALLDAFREKLGGFKNQPQQLMFGGGFSEFHVEQEFAVNRYR